jgi:cholesterol oxidase
MNRLSKPITELKPEYEVVVIGSGYGGSIAASRMARCGRKVCLLEKGKEFLPGEFPEHFSQARSEMQLNLPKRHIGPVNGLYEFVTGEGISVFKGCGLGGTSLVNANVSIEAEERVFADPCWPKEIREDMGSLQNGLAHAREMLKPSPYPEGKNGYPVLQKTEGMRKSALAMNEKFRLTDINVNFEDKLNHVGVHQNRCNNCGDCVTGCNHTAKNTTQMNYLPDAFNHGAEIFTEVYVTHVGQSAGKWMVYFNILNSGREKFNAPEMFILADMVFVCAGSVNSTEILLRSSKKGLRLSGVLGKRFTGNGDVLGFGYNNDFPVHGIGLGVKADNGMLHEVGPCITSVIDMRYKTELTDGMTLEEGSVPGPIKGILTPAFISLSRLMGRDTDKGFNDFIREKWRAIKSLVGGVYRGAIDNTQVYLVMTHDEGDGEIELKDDRPTIKWKNVGKEKIFQKVSDNLNKATKALGGTYIKNPTWTKLMDFDLVTVHPLGGCIMGDDASSGVVDHKGQVFAGNTGKTLYPGLFVMDGAIIPRPLGTNPLLTISGLAERGCKVIADEQGWKMDYSFPPVPERPSKQGKQGIQFTETMKGFFSTGDQQDYNKAYENGKANQSSFEFTLTIHADDADRFIAEPAHEAGMTGTVVAPALSESPMTVTGGKFNLFTADPGDPSHKKMDYAMEINSIEGKSYFFKGFKDVQNNKGLDMWKDTTTLFITIYNGKSEKDPVMGRGILKIEIADFAKQATTMKAIHASTPADGNKIIMKFGQYFAGNLWNTYFKNKEPNQN